MVSSSSPDGSASLGVAPGASLITVLAPLFEWVQGADHTNPDTLRSRNNRAMSYLAAGRPAQGDPAV